ncbi:MAG: YlmH/Sll1252 family protein [Sarcina sp.]
MINKESFVITFKNAQKLNIIKLFNIYEKAYSRGIKVYTDEFYPPAIWKYLEVYSDNSINIESYGLFKDSDRRIIAFNKEEWDQYPLVLLKIECDTRFTKVEHKDYLGSIMSLNIKREKMGDIILKDGICYIVTFEKIATYIKENLHKVKNLSCKCSILDINSEIPSVEYKELIINVASRRLDSIVSELANISRVKAVDIINKGDVLIDYLEVNDKSSIVEDNSRITIKKIGKFKIKEILGTTKSGRLKITVLKYA